MTPMGKAVNHPLVFDSRVYRATATHGPDVDKVYLHSDEIETLCVLRDKDYEIHFTKKKKLERFTVCSIVGLALERFYLERRGDAKEIFRLGSKKVDKKVKQQAGFIEVNVLE